MSKRARTALIILVPIVLLIVVGLAFPSSGQNTAYKPQNEFQLDPWISLKLGPIDMSINKAVLYLFLAAILTTVTMVYIAKRMQDRPNRVQTAVETIFTFSRDNIAGGNLTGPMLRKWFPFIATLFLFILFSNLIGYIPLPTNSQETFDVFGAHIPSFAIYAATANISVPLALSLVVWFGYHYEGVREKGPIGYLRSWIPSGTPKGPMKGLIFGIEVISQFVRVISLSVRLFANILAGHLLILFMAGGLVVLLGIAALGIITVPLAIVFFLFEVVLIAGLQAFIFATLTAIYLGGAVADEH
jgi:F-type H+-transporting ATPase subunit a